MTRKRQRGSGRPRPPRPKAGRPTERLDLTTGSAPSPKGGLARALVVPVIAVVAAIGIGVWLGLRSGNGAVDIDAAATTPVTAQMATDTAPQVRESAKDVFAHTCGSCHTLAAAGATGGIGPNLDEAKPTREQALTMIRNGSLSGAMPAGLLTGDDAERVAAYVSRNAGR